MTKNGLFLIENSYWEATVLPCRALNALARLFVYVASNGAEISGMEKKNVGAGFADANLWRC